MNVHEILRGFGGKSVTLHGAQTKIAIFFGISVAAVNKWVKTGVIPKSRLSDLENFISGKENEPSKEQKKEILFNSLNIQKILCFFNISYSRGWQKKLSLQLDCNPATISRWLKKQVATSKYFPPELIELLGE